MGDDGAARDARRARPESGASFAMTSAPQCGPG